HTRSKRDWSSDVCSSDLVRFIDGVAPGVIVARLPSPDLQVDCLCEQTHHGLGGSAKRPTTAALIRSYSGRKDTDREPSDSCETRPALARWLHSASTGRSAGGHFS